MLHELLDKHSLQFISKFYNYVFVHVYFFCTYLDCE